MTAVVEDDGSRPRRGRPAGARGRAARRARHRARDRCLRAVLRRAGRGVRPLGPADVGALAADFTGASQFAFVGVAGGGAAVLLALGSTPFVPAGVPVLLAALPAVAWALRPVPRVPGGDPAPGDRP